MIGRKLAALIVAALAVATATAAFAQDRPGILPVPPVNDDGSITTPSFTLPFSSFASEEATAEFVTRLRNPMPIIADIAQARANVDRGIAPSIAAAGLRYPYTAERSEIGGVRVETFTPAAGIAPENRNRVLIELHGGAFVAGGGGPGGAIESIPIAGVVRIKVIAVDYRLQPEHTMDDAIADVRTVYRELLRAYRPENIGIYGCSAGGALSGLATAAFIREGLPVPGAIGVFCSSLRGFGGGDSAQLWPRMGSVLRMPPAAPPPRGSAPTDPLAINADVLRSFPPTLFLTGTRAPEMSGATQSHIELRLLGVRSELLLFDGLDHGFISDTDLPEARRAYDLIAQFFGENLGVRRRARR